MNAMSDPAYNIKPDPACARTYDIIQPFMKLRFILPAVLSLSLVCSASYADKNDNKKDPYERLDAFAQILNVIESNYVDTIDRTKVIDGAINGMIRALDPHSSFMSATERRDFEMKTKGQFVGIGVEVGIRENVLQIITAIAGGPAAEAGLESGDTILAIDGEDVSKMSLDHLYVRLHGEIGSKVTLTVRHVNMLAPRNHTITRAIVKTPITFSKLLDPHYGYVSLKSFGQGSAVKVKEEIERLQAVVKGDLRGIVLDLRQNPGGFIREATELADYFLDSGTIVETRGRDGVVIQTYKASMRRAFDIPVVVLIDNGSASASEIVAGALQANKRAYVVGTTSFGKASVQNLFTLKDGSTLKLTIGRYYTPDGRSLQTLGITPDFYVEAAELVTRAEQRVLREKDLPGALSAGPEATSDEAIRPITPTIEDLQLFTAYNVLRAMSHP